MFRVLVPVDFSDSSTLAGQYALHIAAATRGARLLLLHCYQDYMLDAENANGSSELGAGFSLASEAITDEVLNRNQRDEQGLLDELFEELQHKARRIAPQVEVERAFIYGLPEDVIPEEITRFRPDLMVMGTRGSSNLARSFFGTITTKMVQEVSVPVLTIPQQHKGTALERVLYATDFNQTDLQALDALQHLLHPFAPRIICVHVTSESEKQDRQELDKLQQKLEARVQTDNVRFMLLQGDDVAEALQQFVAEQQVDLVAVNNQKRSMLDSVLHPSLTKKLVLETQVPLLVFHSNPKA
ncbi:nucleotide-binding universal stress UspA family protein [Pontibacter ummariensis]|uniref:Nucleotide-binding universal stress protein, UspA family n=1 Tax=Pontibacter ummariensis TaxID=1610492 RepID=A0A239E971_9BACT|nr:universal stress protein [Pontibacter ummariensis]PRY13140.1 nucleotide-binding universal stress UspA family protein [Pontibacter ummariensis]SNS41029.1 Nucleotide-binding universal stress protein, UspA family [Pontibacter ummariensis]